MHESALARAILQAALAAAGAEGARRVVGVRGWIRDFEVLRPEALDFHFRAHAVGTIAEGGALALRLSRIAASCPDCAAEFRPETRVFVCPRCGGGAARALDEPGLGVDRIEVE